MIALPVTPGGCWTGGSLRARQADIDHQPEAMRMPKRFPLATAAFAAVVAGVVALGCASREVRVAVPRIEDGDGWRLAAGCQVRKFGLLTDADCDTLGTEGIAIQITRVRAVHPQPREDGRSTIGIELLADRGAWSFASPFVELLVGGRRHAPSDLDEVIVFVKEGRSLPERLEPRRQQYPLPPGEKRFFRLRFDVPQDELRDGFGLRITGLQREGEAVQVPVLRFRFE